MSSLGTTALCTLIGLTMAMTATNARAQLAPAIEAQARAAAAAAQAMTSDSDALLHNYVTPGLSGQPIGTIDGSRSFSANLACQKTASLLEILIQPSGTGDIGLIRIARDSDLDGTMDQVSTVPMPVSGICANGVIGCQPGSWNGCHYWRWDAASTSGIRLAEVAMPELAGCYCINASCGHNLALANLPSVLKDLGGGVVGALTSADPRIGVAQAMIDGPLIRYVGAQATACTPSPTVAQTQYRAEPTAMLGDAVSAASGNSVFQKLVASPAGNGQAAIERRCTIERAVDVTANTFDDIVTASGAFQSVTSCGADCRLYRIGGTGSCGDPPASFTARFIADKPERIVSARITRIETADWLQARVDGTPVASAGKRPWLTDGLPAGDCGVGEVFQVEPDHDFTTALKSGAATVEARIRATGAHKDGWLEVEIRVDASCVASDRLVDLCAGTETDPQCHLVEELVDGVTMVSQGHATGLTPLPQTRILGTAHCTVALTRDFFLRDRRYRCVTDRAADAAPDLSRGAYIIDHSTETLLADRRTAADGSVTTSSQAFALPARPAVAACEPVCKTRTPSANTAAAPGGVMASQQNNPSGWDVSYRACSSDKVCPAGAGEEIVTPCGCLDDFPEAAILMQTVRLAGADLVCTEAPR